ncbi:MAG: flagellar basal body L-ring protein FlgH [Hyphomicrobiales bacterium]
MAVGAKSFFKDIRAKEVGDTLTVRLKLDDQAKLDNSTSRDRNLKENAGVDAAFGYEQQITKWLPNNDDDADAAAALRSGRTPRAAAVSAKGKIDLVVRRRRNPGAAERFARYRGSAGDPRQLRTAATHDFRRHPTADIDPDNSIVRTGGGNSVAYGGRGTRVSCSNRAGRRPGLGYPVFRSSDGRGVVGCRTSRARMTEAAPRGACLRPRNCGLRLWRRASIPSW